jgi:hypothetical protein
MYICVDFSLTVVENKDSMLHTGLLLSSIQSVNGKSELLENCRRILQETNDQIWMRYEPKIHIWAKHYTYAPAPTFFFEK